MRIFARASTWLSLGPLCGPILGSYLQVTFGWRAAFAALGVYSSCLLAASIWRLAETNRHKDPHATDVSGLLANYRTVLGARDFWAYALPGALSYGAIFAFISGSSFVLIGVLDVPTAWFGYCFAFGVSGYMIGTLVCRRLLPALGGTRTLKLGTMVSLVSGTLFLALVLLGIAHWALVLAAMFCTMGAHGINYPIVQSGAVSPFPKQAGTAAGLGGALNMVVAFVIGTAVGASHNGTLYPLAIIVCLLGILVFGSIRMLPATVTRAD
jgi:DHA1 family bicyclomycin/chloramphenicol resistance-like MFS transporter